MDRLVGRRLAVLGHARGPLLGVELPRILRQHVPGFKQRLEVRQNGRPAVANGETLVRTPQSAMSDGEFDDVLVGLDVEGDQAGLEGRVVDTLRIIEGESQAAGSMNFDDGA